MYHNVLVIIIFNVFEEFLHNLTKSFKLFFVLSDTDIDN